MKLCQALDSAKNQKRNNISLMFLKNNHSRNRGIQVNRYYVCVVIMLIRLHIPLIVNERLCFRNWRCWKDFGCEVMVELILERVRVAKA